MIITTGLTEGVRSFEITALIGDQAKPADVVRMLLADAWTLIHIAAHGVVSESTAGDDQLAVSRTGVVLGDGLVLDTSILE